MIGAVVPGLIGLIGFEVAGPGAHWGLLITATAVMLAFAWHTGALAIAVSGMFLYFAGAEASGIASGTILTGTIHSALAATYLWRLARLPRRGTRTATVLVIALLLVMLTSLVLLAEPDGTGATKMTFAPFFMVAPFVAGISLRAEHRAELLRLILVLSLTLCVVSCVHLATHGVGETGTTSVWQGWNPISHALSMAMGAVVALGIGLNRSGRSRVAFVALAFSIAAVTVTAGSRGPLLALMVAAVAHVLLARTHRLATRVAVAVLAVALVAGAQAFMPETMARRFDVEHIESTDYAVNSVAIRWSSFSDAWQLFVDRPFIGIGVGNFTVHSRDGNIYPHNLVLECLAEMGLVGFALFAPLLVLLARRVYAILRARSGTPELWAAHSVALLAVLFFAESNVTGDLQNSSGWWLFLGAAVGYAPRLPRAASSATARYRTLRTDDDAGEGHRPARSGRRPSPGLYLPSN